MRLARHFGRKKPNRAAVRGGGALTVPQTAEINLGFGDSLNLGVYNRDTGAGDWSVLPAGIYDIKPTGIDQVLPLYVAGNVEQTAPTHLSPYESMLAARKAATGLNQYIMNHGYGGSKIVGAGQEWQIGASLHEAAIARWNAGIATAQAAEPGAKLSSITCIIGSNNTNDDRTEIHSAFVAAVNDFLDRVYMNGVSGQTAREGGVKVVIVSLVPEQRYSTNNAELALRDALAAIPNSKYVNLAEGETIDSLHPNLTGNRNFGARWQAAMADTTPATVSFNAAVTAGEGLPYYQDINGISEWMHPVITGGADASLFEIVEYYGAAIPGLNRWRIGYAIQTVSGANLPAYAGNSSDIKHVQISCYDKGGNATVINHTVTVRPQRDWVPTDLPITPIWDASILGYRAYPTLVGYWDFKDAATVTTSGGNIVSVADKTGNGYALSPTGAVPYSASGGPAGSGIAQINTTKLTANVPAGTFPNGLVFASLWRKVGAQTDKNAAPMTRGNGGAGPVQRYGTDMIVGNGAGGSFNYTQSAPNLGNDSRITDWNSHLLAVGATAQERINGSQTASISGYSYGDDSNTIDIGESHWGSPAQTANMELSELAACLPLTVDQLERLEAAGLWATGQQAKIAAGHTYASAAPKW